MEGLEVQISRSESPRHMGGGFSHAAGLGRGTWDPHLHVQGRGQGRELVQVGVGSPPLGAWFQKDPFPMPKGVCSPGRSPTGGGLVGRAETR